jgi:thymidylate synthase ThyX
MDVIRFKDYGQDGSIIRLAAGNCYGLSDPKKDTAAYIRMLVKLKHRAMLEFSWFPFLVSGETLPNLLVAFNNSWVRVLPHGKKFLVYGNGRAWLEWFLGGGIVYPDIAAVFYKKINAALPVLLETVIPPKGCIKIKVKDTDLVPWVAFDISGISRNCSHQLVRHRALSFAQVSTRWVNCKDYKVILPPSLLKNRLVNNNMSISMKLYEELVTKGFKKDDARQLLPSALETRIFAAGDLAGWDNFKKLRSGPEVHWEIKQLCDIISKELGGYYAKGSSLLCRGGYSP